MKTIQQYILFLSLVLLFNSCIGDRKTVIGEDLGDTSFVNTSFKGNAINYTEGMSACDNFSESALAKLYNVSPDLVVIEDPTKSDRYKNPESACMFFIKKGTSDFQWLRGTIMVQREIGIDELMGDVAEAAGTGKNWEEAWNLKKAMSKSAEWVPNMGKAALWNPKKVVLEIKFEGYNLTVRPLKNILNEEEKTLNRDYKAIAIGMAKAAGFIN